MLDINAPLAELDSQIVQALPGAIHPQSETSPKPASTKRRRKSIESRFWSHVQTADGDECWLWTASAFPTVGYGQFCMPSPKTGKRTMRLAHRVAYELSSGEQIPDGVVIKHSDKCTSKLCCRPSHLSRGTLSENTQEAARQGRLGKRKLTADKAREIVALYDNGKGIKTAALAVLFEVSPQNIQHVLRGRSWSHATGVTPPQKKSAKRAKSKQYRRSPQLEMEAAA